MDEGLNIFQGFKKRFLMLIPFKEEICKTINGLKIFDIEIDFKDINFTFKKISNKLEQKYWKKIFFFIFADIKVICKKKKI